MLSSISKFSLLIIFSASFLLLHSVNLEAASCDRNANGEILDTSITPDCTVTPDEVHFPIYKFGLCEEIPTYQNYLTACEFLYDSVAGETVVVTASSNVKLMENATIFPGIYEAAVVLVGNTISVRHSEVFDVDWDGIEDAGPPVIGSSGKYCSTRLDSGSEDDFDSNLDCADDPLEAGLFSETVGAYHTAGACSIVGGSIVSNLSFTTNSGSTTVCGMLDEDTLETYAAGDTDATRQLIVQTFANEVTISPDTVSLDIAFKVTDMLSIENPAGDWIQAYLDGVEVAIEVD